MKLSQATPAIVRETWNQASSFASERPYMADVLTGAIAALYATFADSLVLARAFLTVPYHLLPPRQQESARDVASSVCLESLLGPHTPVLSLLGTRGELPAWNDPKASRGHVGIPLLSQDFVATIPMIACLLKELGMPLTWVQDPGTALDRQTISVESGMFFVADAASAIDEIGRKVIPAQDFVAAHAVRSVFAVGGTGFGGAMLMLIFFSRESLEPKIARAFMPLVNQVKGLCVERCSMSRIFLPESPSLPQRP